MLRLGQGQRWTRLGPLLKRTCATSCKHVVAFSAFRTGDSCEMLWSTVCDSHGVHPVFVRLFLIRLVYMIIISDKA